MKAYVILASLASLVACAGPESEAENNRSSEFDPQATDVSLHADVDADSGQEGGFALSGTSIDDYKLQISCGAPAIAATYSKADVAANKAKVPLYGTGCFAALSEFSVTIDGRRRVMVPTQALSAASFGNFTVGTSEAYQENPDQHELTATVVLKGKIPVTINAAVASVNVSFLVGIGAWKDQSNQTLEVQRLTETVKSTVSGPIPPAFAPASAEVFLSSRVAAEKSGICAFKVQLRCTKDLVAQSGKLKSCDGVALSDLTYSYSLSGNAIKTAVALSDASSEIGMLLVSLPVDLPCARDTNVAAEELKKFELKITNKSEACETGGACSSTTFAIPSLKLNYKDI